MVEILWLSVMLLGGAWWLRRDVAEYRHFVALEDSEARQRTYAKWILQTFAILTSASLVSLWLAGGLWPFDSLPSPFAAVHAKLQPPQTGASGDMLLGMAIGISINIILGGIILWRRLQKFVAQLHAPFDPLVPRNRREAAYAFILSLNAGFSEELFFRLALPLLLYHLSGSLVLAFALSTLCFGLAHAYQGWKGIALTMLVGGFLALVYLKTGSLLYAMFLHAMIDIIALLLRPLLMRAIARRFPPPSRDALA